MIYLKIIRAIMKTGIKIARIIFWLILGIAILLTNLALNSPSSFLQKATATPTSQAGAGGEGAGSTDGIMIVSVLIVLIVIIPILLRRQVWENGKKK
jgi:uncharacterized membrane protein